MMRLSPPDTIWLAFINGKRLPEKWWPSAEQVAAYAKNTFTLEDVVEAVPYVLRDGALK